MQLLPLFLLGVRDERNWKLYMEAVSRMHLKNTCMRRANEKFNTHFEVRKPLPCFEQSECMEKRKNSANRAKAQSCNTCMHNYKPAFELVPTVVWENGWGTEMLLEMLEVENIVVSLKKNVLNELAHLHVFFFF